VASGRSEPARASTAGPADGGVREGGVREAGVREAAEALVTAQVLGEPMPTRVRVAVVGLGWAGRSIWLPRLADHASFEVVAAVDPSPDARAALTAADPGAVGASRRGGASGTGIAILERISELRASTVDLAVVAVPNHRHAEVAVDLLLAGVPVFLEKPVCLSSTEAEALAAAEASTGATLLAGSAARARADIMALYDVVASLGDIRHVEASWVRARGVPDAGGWFTQRRLAGGGALVDLGWHLLDTIAPIVGAGGFTQAVGTVSDDFVRNASWGAAWRHTESAPKSDGDVEDTARAFLVGDNGVSVALRASWASHQARDATVITVEGSAGVATLTCTFGFSPNRRPGSTLTVVRAGETLAVPLLEEPIGSEYRRQLDELPAMLADPDQLGRAIAEATPTIAAIERIYDSARLACPPIPMARLGG
jgi:oxidoreductase